jgi:hypothetical protein
MKTRTVRYGNYFYLFLNVIMFKKCAGRRRFLKQTISTSFDRRLLLLRVKNKLEKIRQSRKKTFQ